MIKCGFLTTAIVACSLAFGGVASAQFWIMVPVFLLTEANLGVLGLGVTEPIPSWGNMLSELQNYRRIPEAPWILAPAVLLVLVVASLHFVVSGRKTWE